MKEKREFPIIKHLNSASETREFAADFARLLKKGDLILFTGEIGTGKTTFIQALAKEIGISETVTSPTFVLHTLYETKKLTLSHVDIYRLNTDEEIESIGFEDYYDDAVTVVEWADRYSGFTPPYIILHFEYGIKDEERLLSILPNGGDWAKRLEPIARN
ncbi:MAG: tRNA (adenosine(37)-N6)-threonylcarbamoyltransferase complex ATPase subunit type 1 TsaE [Clostridiales bacterium]|nr:tRNA (adenosine(37)-N6)-threonylcarbamoyltransferase complex ATPase subunit type 1 TsaE [Clostridiales bacterium]